MNKENILSKISKMSEEELRDLARSTSDVETLNILAENENYKVRCTVAENKDTPKEALAVLARDEDYWVRCTVAGNINTPVELLSVLAKDKFWKVRLGVVGNKNAPIEALEALSIDNNKLVSETAEEALKERKEKSKARMER